MDTECASMRAHLSASKALATSDVPRRRCIRRCQPWRSGLALSHFDRPPGVPIVDVLGPQRPPRLPTHSASTTAAIAGTPPFNRQDAGTRSLIGGVAVDARPAGRTVVVSTDGRYPQSANRRVPNVAWPFRPHLRADGGQAAARSAPHRRARRRVPRSAVRDDSTHSPPETLAGPGRMPPLLGGIAYAPRPPRSFVRW